MLAMIAALLAAAMPAQPTQPDRTVRPEMLEGQWRTSQMEMAGALELSAGGRFRYALSYGAVDEVGEGRWELTGDRIVLTSDPMPTPPAFRLVSDQPLPRGQLRVELEPPGFGFNGSYDVLLYHEGRPSPGTAKAMSDGLVSLGDRPYPDRVVPAVPFYPVEPGGAVRLDPRSGHRLVFRFMPNDLGKAAFKGEQLMIEGETLSMIRFDTGIRFRKVTP